MIRRCLSGTARSHRRGASVLEYAILLMFIVGFSWRALFELYDVVWNDPLPELEVVDCVILQAPNCNDVTTSLSFTDLDNVEPATNALSDTATISINFDSLVTRHARLTAERIGGGTPPTVSINNGAFAPGTTPQLIETNHTVQLQGLSPPGNGQTASYLVSVDVAGKVFTTTWNVRTRGWDDEPDPFAFTDVRDQASGVTLTQIFVPVGYTDMARVRLALSNAAGFTSARVCIGNSSVNTDANFATCKNAADTTAPLASPAAFRTLSAAGGADAAADPGAGGTSLTPGAPRAAAAAAQLVNGRGQPVSPSWLWINPGQAVKVELVLGQADGAALGATLTIGDNYSDPSGHADGISDTWDVGMRDEVPILMCDDAEWDTAAFRAAYPGVTKNPGVNCYRASDLVINWASVSWSEKVGEITPVGFNAPACYDLEGESPSPTWRDPATGTVHSCKVYDDRYVATYGPNDPQWPAGSKAWPITTPPKPYAFNVPADSEKCAVMHRKLQHTTVVALGDTDDNWTGAHESVPVAEEVLGCFYPGNKIKFSVRAEPRTAGYSNLLVPFAVEGKQATVTVNVDNKAAPAQWGFQYGVVPVGQTYTTISYPTPRNIDWTTPAPVYLTELSGYAGSDSQWRFALSKDDGEAGNWSPWIDDVTDVSGSRVLKCPAPNAGTNPPTLPTSTSKPNCFTLEPKAVFQIKMTAKAAKTYYSRLTVGEAFRDARVRGGSAPNDTVQMPGNQVFHTTTREFSNSDARLGGNVCIETNGASPFNRTVHVRATQYVGTYDGTSNQANWHLTRTPGTTDESFRSLGGDVKYNAVDDKKQNYYNDEGNVNSSKQQKQSSGDSLWSYVEDDGSAVFSINPDGFFCFHTMSWDWPKSVVKVELCQVLLNSGGDTFNPTFRDPATRNCVSHTWVNTATRTPDAIPDPLTFAASTAAPGNTAVRSQVRQITGINVPTVLRVSIPTGYSAPSAVAIVRGERKPFTAGVTSQDFMVYPNDTVQMELTTGSPIGQRTPPYRMTVSVGGEWPKLAGTPGVPGTPVTANWDVVTVDQEPDDIVINWPDPATIIPGPGRFALSEPVHVIHFDAPIEVTPPATVSVGSETGLSVKVWINDAAVSPPMLQPPGANRSDYTFRLMVDTPKTDGAMVSVPNIRVGTKTFSTSFRIGAADRMPEAFDIGDDTANAALGATRTGKEVTLAGFTARAFATLSATAPAGKNPGTTVMEIDKGDGLGWRNLGTVNVGVDTGHKIRVTHKSPEVRGTPVTISVAVGNETGARVSDTWVVATPP